MKCGLIILSIFSLSVVSANAEYWFDNFDSYPAGPLDEQPGWGGSSPTVEIVSSGADSPPNAVYLQPGFLTTRSAIYNDVDMAGGTILRTSFRLYRDNPSLSFSMDLMDGTTSRLKMGTDTSDGTITLGGTNLGVVYPNGVYATFTVFYNKSTDDIAMDLNGTRILEWQDIGITSFSSIDNIRFRRICGSSDSGTLFVDDVSVQTIPLDVQAWWRFEEGIDPYAYEETGHFKPDTYIANVGGGWTSATPAVYSLFNGDEAVRNRKGRINTSINTLDQGKNIDLGNNWTIEFIASFSGAFNCILFEWTKIYPPESTTGAWIKVYWMSAGQEIGIKLRDDHAAAGEDGYFVMGTVPRDGRWHHIAITKQATALQGYVDYQNGNSYTLGFATDGSYSYDADSYAYIGQNSAGDWPATGGILLDEIRISDNVDLLKFLRIDHPRFTQMKVNVPSTALHPAQNQHAFGFMG